jgi:anti-anti-sigma factor
MDISETTHGAAVVVKATGPLTGEAGGQLGRRVGELTRTSLGRVVLDLSDVPFMDSGGVEALVDFADALSDLGLSPRLCGAPATMKEVLRITGHAGLFEMHEDATSAIRSFL